MDFNVIVVETQHCCVSKWILIDYNWL